MFTKASFEYKDPITSTIRISWGVHSTSGNHILEELPSEIITIHPLLGLDNQKYRATTFYTASHIYAKLFSGRQDEYIFSGISISAP